MKKTFAKTITAALLSSAVISLTSATVFAADYGSGASPTTVTPNTTNVTSTDAGSTENKATTILTDTAVSGAISDAAKKGEDNVTVYMEEDSNGKVTVQETAIAEIAKSTVKVTVEVKADKSSGTAYSITIDPALITEPKAINLAMDIKVDVPANTVESGVDIPAGSIVIAPQQKGDFGMTVSVNLPASALKSLDMNNAAIYYISDSGDVTKLTDSITFNADGSASIAISHASEYVISDVDLTESGVTGIIDSIFDDDEDEEAFEIDEDASVIDDFIAESDTDDGNPGTGVGVAFSALAVPAAAILVSRKRK